MARTCPQCMTAIPAGDAVAFSNSIECPGCKRKLVVSDGSRYAATLVGLLVAVLVWRIFGSTVGMLGWVKPVLVTFLAFGISAPLALVFVADFRLKPEEPTYEPAATASHGLH